MSDREFRTLKTNAGSMAGRPQKYGETWRRELAERDPMTPKEYQRWIIDQVVEAGGRVGYGYAENKKFVEVSYEEFKHGHPINCIIKILPGQKPEYMDAEIFDRNYEKYIQNFTKVQRLVTTGYAYTVSSLPFEDGAGLK